MCPKSLRDKAFSADSCTPRTVRLLSELSAVHPHGGKEKTATGRSHPPPHGGNRLARFTRRKHPSRDFAQPRALRQDTRHRRRHGVLLVQVGIGQVHVALGHHQRCMAELALKGENVAAPAQEQER